MTCASLPIIFPPCETAPCRGRVAKYPLEVALFLDSLCQEFITELSNAQYIILNHSYMRNKTIIGGNQDSINIGIFEIFIFVHDGNHEN